jgi:cholesterol transport system auxiliary component
MRYLLYICLTSLLTACLGANRPGPESAIYDFGLASKPDRIDTRVDIGRITAVDAVDHRRIRYRLDYRNPAQIHTYAQNRWASSPAALLESRVRSITNAAKQAHCGIHLEIEAFDQVFSSPNASSGVVSLHATLYAKQPRRNLFSHMVQTSSTAPSADSKGAVAALDSASSQAILQILQWADESAAKAPECAS